MSTLRFHTLDVFSGNAFGGNPLAVVLGGDALSTAQMQRIAREFNLSETVFMLNPSQDGAMIRVRIFTPYQELPFAGHPIVGTGCLLAHMGMAPPGSDVRFTFEAGVGLVPVLIRNTCTPPYAELSVAQMPQFPGNTTDTAAIATALGLQPQDIGWQQEQALVASCGLPMLLVPLRMPELLAGIEIDTLALSRLLDACDARGIYVYARGYEDELRARMFSPGIGEDPATGSAAVALAGRLATESAQGEGTLAWTVHQGVEMGRPSQLFISADKSAGLVVAVRVGGHAVYIMEGRLHAF